MTDSPEQTLANLVAADCLLAAGFAAEAHHLLVRLESRRAANAISHIKIGRAQDARTWLAEAIAGCRSEIAALDARASTPPA